MINKICSWLAWVVVLWACGADKDATTGNTLFTLMDPDATGVRFRNDIRDNEQFNIFTYRNFYNGAGVAIGDVNNDSLPDVFFAANMGANQLYLNRGNLQFEPAGEEAGIALADSWSTGVVMADVNADGWLDIYVCNAGYEKGRNTHNALFINNRNGTFTDSARAYGLDNDGYTTHAAFFDYDLDGDLDCYILNNSFIPVNTLNNSNRRDLRAKDWPVEEHLKGGGSFLMRNDGGRFTDVSEEAGIYGSLISFGLGVTVGDVNGDLYPDLYISNDFYERDYLYINQQNGTFSEELESRTEHISQSSMGADLADVNNDGYPDIFVTDMLPGEDSRLKTTTSFETYDVYQLKVNLGFHHQYMQNTLQVNNRNGKFVDVARYSGVAATDWSWGGLVFDADNDGLSDLYVCNGIHRDLTDQDFVDFFANDIIRRAVTTGTRDKLLEVIDKMPSRPQKNKAFRNLGNLAFSDAGDSWGFAQPSFSNGAAYADLDNDGDLDMVVSNVNDQAFVYRNNQAQQPGNAYIAVTLRGKGQNRFAVGSTIRVFCGDEVLTRELMPSRGYQSSVDYKVLIGLGSRQPDSMHIIWPDRTYTRIKTPATGQTHDVAWPGDAPLYPPAPASPRVLFGLAPSPAFAKHSEDGYVDFYTERNMPVMLSREGPRAAVADVNGDRLDDVYIGGAAGQSGQLYLQTASGFVSSPQPAFASMAGFEDVAVLFFDADRDGDNDLMVGSGGNHLLGGIREMQNRLYKNNGKGQFALDTLALPENAGNTSTISAVDYDGDGFLDLWVASKGMPRQYGALPRHYLLHNKGNGQFEDFTAQVFPQAASLGFVTSAVWAQLTGDARPELIVAGEWMAPRIFSFVGRRLQAVETHMGNMQGWWQSLAATDVDGDGDIDLLLGNMGLNGYLKPDSLHPVKLWYGDFDGNRLNEQILTYGVEGKDKPVFLKRDLIDQLPSLQTQNLQSAAFAEKSVQELFGREELDMAMQFRFDQPASGVAINQGAGRFSFLPFPAMVQWSSVHAICVADLNGDALPDLLLGGNDYAMLPQFGRLDGSFGHVLLNAGQGAFRWMEPRESGIQIRGAIRDIRALGGPHGGFLFLRNNDYPVLVRRGAPIPAWVDETKAKPGN